MARVRIASRTTSDGEVVFNFANGKTLQVNLGDVVANGNVEKLAVFGLGEKIASAFVSGDVESSYRRAVEMVELLRKGEFRFESAERGPRIGMLVKAIVRVGDGKASEEQVRAIVEAMDEAGLKRLRGSAKLKSVMAQIRAEETAAAAAEAGGDDLDDLLGSF